MSGLSVYDLKTTEEYKDLRFKLIKQFEGYWESLYLDSAGLLTIGVGFNVQDESVRFKVFSYFYELYLDTASSQYASYTSSEKEFITKINNVLDKTYSSGGKLEVQTQEEKDIAKKLSDILADWKKAVDEDVDGNYTFYPPTSFAITEKDEKSAEDQIKDFFNDKFVPTYEAKVDKFFAGIPESAERVALLSLGYNQRDGKTALLGNGLGTAIGQDNRANAWYEIRYGSNGDKVQAKRRYMESQIFGLFSNPDNVSERDAQQAVEMYITNYTQIREYETKYQAKIKDAAADLGSQGAKIKNAEGNYLTVDSIGQIFKPIAAYLYGRYVSQADSQAYESNKDKIDFQTRITGDVVLGHETQHSADTEAFIQPVYRTLYDESPKEGEPLPAGITGINDMLIALDDKGYNLQGLYGEDILIGGAQADTLYGGYKDERANSGNDVLIGGGGNDSLYGGDGNDVLRGGAGVDSYYFEYANGKDLIIDSDGKGVIYITNTDTDTNFTKAGGATGNLVHVNMGGWLDAWWATDENGHILTDNRYNFGYSSSADAWLLSITVDDGTNLSHSIEILNFRNGDFGLTLNDFPTITDDPQLFEDFPGTPLVALPPKAGRIFDPLTFDLNNDGQIGTRSLFNGVHFDLDNSGFAEKTSWVSASDGLLALDRNSNGFIDGGAELFGSETILQNGNKAANGFEALAEFDSNNDQKIDSADTQFNALRMWRDANSNGIADAGELMGLTAAGIASINLAHTSDSFIDKNRVEHREQGQFTRTDSTTGITNTLWFNRDARQSVAVSELQGNQIIIPADILALPDAAGSGNLHSLHQAMALDTTGQLKQAVTQFVQTTDVVARRALVDTILLLWTNQGGVSPDSRGEHVNAQHLAVLEQFWGDASAQAEPWGSYATAVEQIYQQLEQAVYSQLMQDSHAKVWFDQIEFTRTGPQWHGDFTAVSQSLVNLFVQNDPAASLALQDFMEIVKGMNPYDLNSLYDDFTQSVADAAMAAPQAVRDTILQNVRTGNDSITGTEVGEVIGGYQGNDIVHAASGNDQVFGHEGHDNLYGEAGDDAIYGGVGNDRLFGGEGSDIYHYQLGDGIDFIQETSGFDTIQFGQGINPSSVRLLREGNDLWVMLDENNSLYVADMFIDGNIDLGHSVDKILFGNGDEWDLARIQLELLKGTAGDDVIYGFDTDDVIYSGAGNDEVNGGAGNDYLDGGSGRDRLFGGEGNDTIVVTWEDEVFSGGGGNDLIIIDKTPDMLEETPLFRIEDEDGNNTLAFVGSSGFSEAGLTAIGNDLLLTNTSESVYIVDGLNGSIGHFVTGESIEDITENNSSVNKVDINSLLLSNLTTAVTRTAQLAGTELVGGLMNDNLTAHVGGSILNGGKGSDALKGEIGSDTYLFGVGYGKDTVTEKGGINIIKLQEGIAPEQVSVRRSGANFILSISTTDTITVTGMHNATTGAFVLNKDIQQIEFANGDVWDVAKIKQEMVRGSSAADTIYGFSTNDIVRGGAGNDQLHGIAGDDAYEFGRGDGVDSITDTAGVDAIKFDAGITQSDASVRRAAGTLVITLNTGEKITVNNMFNSSTGVLTAASAIEQVQFTEGNNWDINQLRLEAVKGSDAADTIYGFEANDVIRGGIGNDKLYGVAGNDTYEFGRGDGLDEITDTAGTDTIELGAGIAKADVSVRRNAGDLVLTLNTGEKITVKGMFTSSTGAVVAASAIEKVQFADGSFWDINQLRLEAVKGSNSADSIYGFETNDVIYGGIGNDQLFGVAGNDTYQFNRGDGLDSITDTAGTDVVKMGAGINQSDISVRRSVGNLIITLNTGEQITVNNMFNSSTGALVAASAVEKIEFSDNSFWDINKIRLDAVKGTNAADILYGFDTNDVIVGGQGNDQLLGVAGNDTYEFGRGDGSDIITDTAGIDTIKFAAGIAQTDVSLRRSGATLVVQLNTGEKITVNNMFNSTTGALVDASAVENIQFSNGDIWDKNRLLAEAVTGANGDDSIYGFSTNDIIQGKGGNDHLEGYGGDDTYVFAPGHGSDRIIDNGGNDIIRYSGGITQADVTVRYEANNGYLNLSLATGDRIQIRNMFDKTTSNLVAANALETVQFDTGGSWDINRLKLEALKGSALNDNIQGFSSADIIKGNKGNDLLSGFLGDDIYEFSRGDGADSISDTGGVDTIRFDSTVSSSDVTVYRYQAETYFLLNSGDQIKVEGTLKSGAPDPAKLVERVEFANGEVWDAQQIANKIAETAANPTLLLGKSTWDELHAGGVGNYYINGLAGNDDISGGSGNDTLVGGYGINFLRGNAGSDTYLVTQDMGWNIVDDFSFAQQDKIVFADSIRPEDLHVTIEGSSFYSEIVNGQLYKWSPYDSDEHHSLVLSIGSTQKVIEIRNVFAWDVAQIGAYTNSPEFLSTPMVTFLADGSSLSLIDLISKATSGSDYSELQQGTPQADSIAGLGGDDWLYGYNGNDSLIGGAGNDHLEGGDGHDIYHFEQGFGQDAIYDWLGNDKIRFGAGINPTDIIISREDNRLVFTLPTGDSIKMEGIFVDSTSLATTDRVIESVEFANSTIWDFNQVLDILQNGHTGQQAMGASSTSIVAKPVAADISQYSSITQLDSLIQAMASFAPPAAAESRPLVGYYDANPLVIAVHH